MKADKTMREMLYDVQFVRVNLIFNDGTKEFLTEMPEKQFLKWVNHLKEKGKTHIKYEWKYV
uniref:Uncharacterized protein n=1 Tax=viral metagenome TaxID=1070528 RepID=A0A6H1ZB67_9ZZZZ